jgi:uncharacterized protein
MKPRVVLDTNILLDLFYFKDKSVEYLYKCLKNQAIEAYTCENIWDEFTEVLMRKPFLQSTEAVNLLRNTYQDLLIWRAPSPSATIKCSDPDDQIFIDMAIELAPSLIITKDNDLLKIRKRLFTHGVETLKTYDPEN